MNINDLTFGELKQIAAIFCGDSKMQPVSNSIFFAGQKLFIRTVTYHYTGEVIDVQDGFLRMKNAAWIADSGRFHDALKSSNFSEVEPYPEILNLNIDSIVDFTEVKSLILVQK